MYVQTKAVSLVPLISGLLEIREGGGNAMETEDTAPQSHGKGNVGMFS